MVLAEEVWVGGLIWALAVKDCISVKFKTGDVSKVMAVSKEVGVGSQGRVAWGFGESKWLGGTEWAKA